MISSPRPSRLGAPLSQENQIIRLTDVNNVQGKLDELHRRATSNNAVMTVFNFQRNDIVLSKTTYNSVLRQLESHPIYRSLLTTILHLDVEVDRLLLDKQFIGIIRLLSHLMKFGSKHKQPNLTVIRHSHWHSNKFFVPIFEHICRINRHAQSSLVFLMPYSTNEPPWLNGSITYY